MKYFLSNLLMSLVLVVMLSGCGARKKIVYIQGAEEIGTFENAYPLLTIRPDDKLTIIVNCKEPELAQPFNMMLQQKAFLGGGQSTVSMSYGGGSPQVFYVDPNGDIQYPTIGKLHVQGMTRYQLQDYIQDYLKSNGYITDPIVNVEFYNAKYSILGDVNRPGMFTMSSDRVSLLDALAQAGDLTVFGEREIRLIREKDGKQHVVTIDLKDPEIMKSEYYFLQQNDVIYVEPNHSKASNREVSSLYTFGISIVSLALTIVTFARSFK